MGMASQVERHAFGAGREVRAVVQVETSEKILIGFAGARMLSGRHSRHGLQEIAGPQQHGQLDVVIVDHPFRRRSRQSDAILRPPVHHNFLQRGFLLLSGKNRGTRRQQRNNKPADEIFHDDFLFN